MAETDLHRDAIVDAIQTLQDHFAGRDDVYVSGDLLLYYEEGNPRRSVAPDVFVVQGVPAGKRDIYKLWEEGVAPQWVLEVTSRHTRHEDTDAKPALYAQLGVAEYFRFDPRGDYLRPALQGSVLTEEGYAPLSEGPDGGIHSRALGLTLALRDGMLRFYDPAAERWLPTRAEARREAEAAREQAEAALHDAEAEIARLRALLAQRDAADVTR